MISHTNLSELNVAHINDVNQDIPKIFFDEVNGRLEIAGESYHQYAVEFFKPVFSWVENYILDHHNKKITVDFRMTYFNRSSARRFLEILELLEAHHKNGGKALVNWYYEVQDLDMLDSGYEYASQLSFEFNLIAVE